MTSRTYTHEEMFEEIIEAVEEIGGDVVTIPRTPDGFLGGFKLFIEPDLMDQAKLIVNDIKKKYKKKRMKILNDNPFIGTKEFLDNL